jgi:hypothetical protein
VLFLYKIINVNIPIRIENRKEYNNNNGIYIVSLPVALLTSLIQIGLIINNNKIEIRKEIPIIIIVNC